MKTAILAVAVFGAALALASPEPRPRELSAAADMQNGAGKSLGTATLTESAEGVRIHIQMSGLPPGAHALHLHNVGDCHGPDFKSAGPHFNPYGKKHGAKNQDGPHAGDLPNFEVKADGTADIEVIAKLVTLKEGKNSLFQPGGTCLMVHEKPDDETTDPTGNAGERLVCGILRKK